MPESADPHRAAEALDGRLLVGRYRLGELLGEGAHGRVYLAEDYGRGGAHVALKLLTDQVDAGAWQEEAARALHWFRHPNWADVLDTGRVSEKAWFQTLRHIEGRSLKEVRGPLPPDLVWRFLEDGARVLQALHRTGLIHYDVTPGNFIMEESGTGTRFVLTDGGLAHVGPVTGSQRGTPLYLAPEITEGHHHDHRVDLYSLGLVAFLLATGREPFGEDENAALPLRRSQSAPRARSVNPQVPEALDEVLAALLAQRPDRRPKDGRAVLGLIAEATGTDVPEMRKAEAYAAAEGGQLVGRAQLLERFDRSRLQLSSALAILRSKANGFSVTGIQDPVILLTGSSGAGGTRLLRQMVANAQTAEVPVLVLAGRDGPPHPQAPLAHLLECLNDLGAERGPRLETGNRRSHVDRSRRERAYSKQRTIEDFLRRAHATARRTPFLLAVEDFGDLPELAQGAIRALARDLLSRAEHGLDRAAPPLLLVADLGPSDPQPFLIPDSEEPQRPVLTVPPLEKEESLGICTKAFPHLVLPEGDLNTVHRTAGGLPGALVALLAEAAYRGDLCVEDDQWTWDVSQLGAYEVGRAVPPGLADALRRATPALRALLAYLALAETPLDESVVADLWRGLSATPIPGSSLITTRRDDDRRLYALSSALLRREILHGLEDEPRRLEDHRRALLAALTRHPRPDTLLDRARLHADLHEPREAIEILAAQWSALGSEQRFAAQILLRRALAQDPKLAADADIRNAIAPLLERGPDAVAIATHLANAFPSDTPDLKAVYQVAEILEDAKDLDAALRLLNRHHDAPDAPPADRALLNIRRALLALDQGHERDGEQAHEEARAALKASLRESGAAPVLLAEYLRLKARILFLDGKQQRAITLLRRAERFARRGRTVLLRAQILNNIGVAMANTGREHPARRYLVRSLRIKRTLGDVKGVASSSLNLAHIHLRHGEILEATRLSMDCVRRALRYGLNDTLIRALRLLADAYDRQHRPGLALDTLLRAWRVVGDEARTSETAGLVAWTLAPVAATVGRLDVADEILHATAALARAPVEVRPQNARAMHHLTAALVALYTGQGTRFRTALRRARRQAHEMRTGSRWLLGMLAPLAFPDDSAFADGLLTGARHLSNPPTHFLYRTHVWFRRALRNHRAAAGRRLAPVSKHPLGARLEAGTRREARAVPAGSLGRLACELLLRAAAHSPPLLDDATLAHLHAYAALSDAPLLQARALAIGSLQPAGGNTHRRAQQFSQAVAHVAGITPARSRALRPLPEEILDAADRLATHLRLEPTKDATLAGLHALAHQALVRPGRVLRAGSTQTGLVPHERLAAALRHVLEASARMRGANGVRQLLAAIAQHTIDITGAQRACLVLREADSDMEIWESASVLEEHDPVALHEVSNTVIQRVLDRQTPVFRPYVVEDSDLVQDSASIEKLKLLSILCVPVRRRGALYGVLYADSTSVGAFEPVDVEVLSLFADQAAAAIETSRLVEDVQRSFAELKAMQDRLVRGERLRVIGELSSGVAHEFNNLLTAILARIQMMSLNYLPPEARRDLELIEKAALDAAAVVRRLQSFSRSQRQADFTMVDVGEVCRDAVDLLRPLWRKRGRDGHGAVNVQLRAESALVVRGDPTELREVVTNVLKNAIDSLRDGGRVTLSARRHRGQVHLRIRDNGTGIPPEILAKVFDPFYTTKGERGTGLGLSLSQQIVEKHGGTISIDSAEGVGTTVTVQLPAAEAGARRATDARPAEAGKQPALRIVVVDDDRDVLRSLCTYLERSGYEVIPAANGSDGYEKAMQHEPDVVLTDVSMPEMDGIELCRRLHEARPHLPIVLMSGWASDLNHASAREAGARDVLSKPFEMPEVTRLLASVSNKR